MVGPLLAEHRAVGWATLEGDTLVPGVLLSLVSFSPLRLSPHLLPSSTAPPHLCQHLVLIVSTSPT